MKIPVQSHHALIFRGVTLLLLLLGMWSSTIFRHVTNLITLLTYSVTRAIVVKTEFVALLLFPCIRT
ncbi:hypothetical protein Hdeb2414_s0003g00098581 [Helianthus debilis subsp. tardiflorus]